MSKSLTVVAFALFVLTGAMGLRNIASSIGATSASNLSSSAIWANGPGTPPPPPPGGGH
jgi:hypothetical protein